MDLKITTLIENNPDDNDTLLFEHGLSLYIEMDGKKILFDTGQSGKFIDNAKSLNKSLQELDYVIISHGHYDHSGGIKRMVREVEILPTFLVGEEFFKPKYKRLENQSYKFNGNSFDEKYLNAHQISLRKIKEDMVFLTEHMIVFHHFRKYTDYEKRNSKFFIKDEVAYLPDDFEDEICLGIITSKGLVVVVGCSHVGVVNILKTISKRINIPICAVIGGTHLVEADDVRIQRTIDTFKEMKIKMTAVSHCTGEKGIGLMKQQLKEQYFYNNTGKIIEI